MVGASGARSLAADHWVGGARSLAADHWVGLEQWVVLDRDAMKVFQFQRIAREINLF